MRVFTNAEEINEAPKPVYDFIETLLKQCELEDEDAYAKDAFNSIFGGAFYLVENEEDLKSIYTSTESNLPPDEQEEICGGWASIVEKADVFDTCEHILDGTYVQILLCTNNEGGNTFIIPRGIADKCDNIRRSIMLTKEAWQNNEGH
jgi:hypothetical protein